MLGKIASLGAFALALFVAGSAAADPPPPPPAPLPDKPPLSFTVGGGVSLGAYQAGVLYFTSQTASANALTVSLKLVSGASAGTINALLSILAVYGKPGDDPEDNLLWNIWSGVGFDQLFIPEKDMSATAALSNKALNDVAENLRRAWKRGLSATCDVVFVVAATRISETRAATSGSLNAPRVKEHFTLRIRGRGYGIAPEIHNYVERGDAAQQILLALPRDQSTSAGIDEAFDRLKEVLLASAAFPVAFPPVRVRLCVHHGGRPSTLGTSECGGPTHEHGELFMDGGVFDNTSLRLAYRTARRLEPVDGLWTWGEEEPKETARPPAEMMFALVDKDNAGYPDAPDEDRSSGLAGERSSLLSYLGMFASRFVSTSMASEIAALNEEAPGFASHVLSTVRYFPSASGHLANFFGFFEREFRRFDFYLGMYDASRFAAEHADKLVKVHAGRGAAAPPLPPALARSDAFRCMIAAYSDEGAPADVCKNKGLEAFRILVQVSLDRLYSECECLKHNSAAKRTTHALCKKAMSAPPEDERRIVPGVARARTAAWRREPGESTLTHMMRLLAYYEFPFKDFGLDAKHADSAMSIVRDRIGQVVHALASRQGFGEGILISLSGKVALNFLHYTPPATIVYGDIGRGYEVGASWLAARFTDASSLRWSLAVEGKGLESLVDAAEHRAKVSLSWGAVTGPEIEFYGNPIVQVHVGLRGGFQLSTRGWGSPADFARSSAGGSLPVFQVVPSIALFERLRLKFTYERFIPTKAVPAPAWDVLYGVGWQFLSPFR